MINKKWRRDASDNAINALMRVGGCALTSIVLKKVTSEAFTSQSNVNQTIGNIASPIVSAAAIAGDIFLANPMLRAFCQGVYTYAVPKTVAQIAPAVGEYMGLSGAIMHGVPPQIMHGVPRQIMHGTTTPALPTASTTAATPAQAAMMAVAQGVQKSTKPAEPQISSMLLNG